MLVFFKYCFFPFRFLFLFSVFVFLVYVFSRVEYRFCLRDILGRAVKLVSYLQAKYRDGLHRYISETDSSHS